MATSKKISAQMATSIALDTVSAAKSLKSLQSSISATATAWKTLSAQQKSSGDEMASLQTKARGLQEVYDKQSQKIAQLKSRQEELTKGLGENGKMSESTAQKYLRLQNQIERLQAQQVSEKKQIDQTNQAIKYHESGLAGLQNQMKQNQTVTSSLVQRLQAEGKERKAIKAQLDGEKSSLNNLNQQYKIQESELNNLQSKLKQLNSQYETEKNNIDKVGKLYGTNSSVYKKQVQAVENLDKAIKDTNANFKTQQVRLNNTGTAIAKTESKVNTLKDSYRKVPKNVNTKVNADTSKAKANVESFTSVLKGVSLGSMVAQAGMKALQVVTDSFGSAVERYDTLNNFPKILESMGASADDAKKSMETLKKGVDGLPTSLDTVAKTSEKLLPMSKNAQDASKSAIALNDAFLASKASSEDASRGLEQYSQMLSAGKVDLQSWKTLQETMPASLTKVAKSLGIASGSTKELYEQLKSGKITMTQLNEKFQELDQGADGFHQEAKTASDGIGTAFANMKNRTAKALADVLEGFNNLVKDVTGSSLAENINNLSSKFANFGKKAKKAIEDLGPIIKKGIKWFSDFKPIILGVASAFGAFKVLTTVKKAVDTFKGSMKALNVVLKANPVILITSAIIGLGVALVTAYKKVGWFRKMCDSAFSAIGKAVKAVGKVFSNIGKTIGNVFSGISKGASNCANWVSNHFESLKNGVTSAVSNVKENVSSKWNNMCNTVSSVTEGFKNGISGKWGNLSNDVIEKGSKAMGVSKETFSNGYETIKSATNVWKDVTSGKWGEAKKDLETTGNNIKETAKSAFSDMYGKLDDMTGGGLTKVKNKWTECWNGIKETVQNAVKNVGNAVVDVVNNVIEPMNKMLDKVKDGVNWILDKFGASKWQGYQIPKVPHFATGGIVGGGSAQKGKGTFALVNDAPGKNYREMFATPDGKLGMFPKERNFMTWLPHGTQVLPGEQSKALADMLGIPQYKDGTDDKNIFQKIFDKGWDMLKEVANVIAHPVKFMEKVLTDKLNITTNVKVASDVIKHAPHAIAEWGKEWLKKMAEDWKKKKDEEASVGGFGNIPEVVDGQNLRELVKKALEANGLSTSEDMIARVLRQIATESGGNAHAVQPGADPDGDGSGPAMGLMQTKRGTFNAYKAPGHDDIFNAYDNLLAALNYAKHRYGPSLSFLGNGHGYANGGFINSEQLAMVGEQNKPEVVIPLSSEKQGRALDLLTQTVNKLNRNNGRQTRITTNDNSGLEDKLDKVIMLLGSILGVNQQQLNKNDGINLNGLYQQMYKDQQINNYQSI